MKNKVYTLLKRFVFVVKILVVALLVFISKSTNAQCLPGTSTNSINWDYLDYFPFTGNYTSNYLPSNTWTRTQNFTFGTQRLTIVHNYADANAPGENTTHTGETGTFGTGADVQYIGDGTITLTFENEVNNLQFSLYDVDRGQRVQFGATNALGISQLINVATLTGTILTISNNNLINARVDAAAGTNIANNLNTAACNVTIAGPVKTITLTISNTTTNGSEDGSFWLSDISACFAGSFPNNYFNIARPFTNQPGYVLHAFNDSVMMVNPATGVTKFLFEDASAPYGGKSYVNSMAYDPYNHVLYYVFSLSNNASANKLLKKYDFTTETISTVVADINTIGVPTVSGSTTRGGVESGAACFYNGALYLGIETSNNSTNSSREVVIWRLDFNASNVPYRASQVFALPVDNGAGTLTHDWSDFIMSNGMLYDFDGAGTTTQTDIYHFNMTTGATTNYPLPSGYTPGQPTVDWTGNIYQVHASTTPSVINPYIAIYNLDGTIGTRYNMTSTPAFTPAVPSLGDAAEAFRPKGDFGDAPSSYDPDPLAPATHEYNPNLRLGPTYDREWSLTSSTNANADGADEDGLGAAPALLPGLTNYFLTVSVYNNTGANANLVAWLDYNQNGLFDAGEAQTATVTSSGSSQNINLSWLSITATASTNLYTFLRIRIAPSSTGMGAANMNGWYADGEVEDYPVLMGWLVPKELNSFSATKKAKQQTLLNWSVNPLPGVNDFTVERSGDNTSWSNLGIVKTINAAASAAYNFTDNKALNGTSYYRIVFNYADGTKKYSEIKSVYNNSLPGISIMPNPAQSQTSIKINSGSNSIASVALTDFNGKQLINRIQPLIEGDNTIWLNNLDKLPQGVYVVRVEVNGNISIHKLLVNH
jgi:hypothetical protein